jgi:predicted small lipoprotein YifL
MLIRHAAAMAAPLVLAVLIATVAGCGKKPPVARPTPPRSVQHPCPPRAARRQRQRHLTGSTSSTAPLRGASAPEPVAEPPIVPAEPVRDDTRRSTI